MMGHRGRWAHATGEVGPLSNTIIAGVEGWAANLATETRLKRVA